MKRSLQNQSITFKDCIIPPDMALLPCARSVDAVCAGGETGVSCGR